MCVTGLIIVFKYSNCVPSVHQLIALLIIIMKNSPLNTICTFWSITLCYHYLYNNISIKNILSIIHVHCVSMFTSSHLTN